MTDSQGEPTASVQVNGKALKKSLQALVRLVKPKHDGQAVIYMRDESLVFRVGGGEAAALATGSWPGEARVAGQVVKYLTKLPGAELNQFRIEAGRLCIPGYSAPCEWQSAGEARIQIPLGATMQDVYLLGLEHDDHRLEASGILVPVEEARAEVKVIVDRAIEVLEPLGVSPFKVRELVVQATLRYGAERRAMPSGDKP